MVLTVDTVVAAGDTSFVVLTVDTVVAAGDTSPLCSDIINTVTYMSN